jgi:hypothetical protein
MSQADISRFLDLVRGKEADQLGPSFAAVNCLNMVDMLQAFDQLDAADRDRFNQAAFDGIPAKGCGISATLPQAKHVGIDRIKFAYHVVVDKKIPAEVPGDLYETGQLKDAYEYLGTPPPPSQTKTVWATCIGSVCEDARLRKKDDDSIIGADQTYGQAGWEIGIKYARFRDLPGFIKKRCNGYFIKKLALNSHGDAGSFAVNGVNPDQTAIDPAMRAAELEKLKVNFKDELEFLNRVMTQDGILLLAGCLAGKSDGGTILLTRLSLELKPRKIVGFATVGFQSTEKQKRDGDQCREPGARDTGEFYSDPSKEYERYFKSGLWDDLNKMPWQSENSPHAKIAQNGVIIRGQDL